MVLRKWASENPASADMNSLNAEFLSISGLNLIRMLINRDIDFSAGMFDWWGDAYIDVNGRKNSVSAATALFNTIDNTYMIGQQTTGSAETANLATATTEDNDFTVACTINTRCIVNTVRVHNISGTNRDIEVTIKKGDTSIATKTVSVVANSDGVFTFTVSDYSGVLESGDTCNILFTCPAGSYIEKGSNSFDGTIYDIASQLTNSGVSGNEIEMIEIENISTDSIITHTIPAGTFSSTMSSAIGVPFIEDYEAGADIQYKLTGTAGSEDTGWLDCGITPETSSFTAFTAEPDTLIVKLVPKSSSPTSGFPSIRGFCIRAT